MKRIVIILLAIVMVFALCACGNQNGTSGGNEKDNSIAGKWVADVDLMTMLELSDEIDLDELGDEMGDVILPRDIEIQIVMEFSEDGEVEISADCEDAVNEWLEQIADNMVDYLKDVLADSGATEADFEDAYGMNLKEYVEQSMAESLDFDKDDLNLNETGEYKLEGDKLYIDESGEYEEYFVIDLSSKKLTFEDYSDDWGDLAYLEGVSFKRK